MKMKRITILGLVFLLMLTFTLVGCGQKSDGDSADKPKEENKKFVIGFSNDTMNNPWRAEMVNKAKIEAEKYKDKIEIIVTDGQNSSSKQIADVEDLMTRKIDVLLISPHEAQPLSPIVSRAYKAGIPVLVLDRELASEDYTSFIGASNKEIGKKAGEFIAEYLKGKGNVVEIEGIPGASPTRDRSEPMHEVLKKFPGIKIVAKQTANYDENQALQVMENILQANPKGTIDIVYTHADNMALGALKAIKAAGRTEIKVVGVDGQKQALEAIIAGDMLATITYPHPSEEAIKVALKILEGQKVDKLITLPSDLITKDNAKEFYNTNSAF